MIESIMKKNYRKLIKRTEKRPEKISLFKTRIAENFAIIRKRRFYKNINWTKKQQAEFNSFWISVYGKKISDKWNRLYESFNGIYRVDYIPEKLYSLEIEPAFNDYVYSRVFEDKSVLETVCSGCGVTFPETVCVFGGKRFYDNNRSPITECEAIKLLEYADDVVLKPSVGGSSGKGILFIKSFSSLSAEEKKSAIENAGEDFIAQKRLKISPVYSAFNPSSVNTVRVITYIIGGKVFHVPLVLRMGRDGKNVDNIHSGGISVGINDDGTLLKDAYELNYGDKKAIYLKHPDSEVVFEGYRLSKIPEIIESAEKLHGRFPHLGIISWDFTVDDEDNIILIEANIAGQSIWFPQMLHGKGAFGENTKAVFDEMKRLKDRRRY